ncbi:MAG: hypothetical protein ACKVIH_08415 [Burkholderiales bacterium]
MPLVYFSPRLALCLSGLGLAAVLAGCASTTPVVDAAFGDAVRKARTQQTLYPHASANQDPVLGIDGQAGIAAQQRYLDSFQAPPQTFEVQNIGGSITGK